MRLSFVNLTISAVFYSGSNHLYPFIPHGFVDFFNLTVGAAVYACLFLMNLAISVAFHCESSHLYQLIPCQFVNTYSFSLWERLFLSVFPSWIY